EGARLRDPRLACHLLPCLDDLQHQRRLDQAHLLEGVLERLLEGDHVSSSASLPSPTRQRLPRTGTSSGRAEEIMVWAPGRAAANRRALPSSSSLNTSSSKRMGGLPSRSVTDWWTARRKASAVVRCSPWEPWTRTSWPSDRKSTRLNS